MKTAALFLALCFATIAGPAAAVDAGVVTIVEGQARVLRGAVWYRLVPGANVQDGDIVEAVDRAEVQLELTAGATLNLVGPGALYAAVIPARSDKNATPMEFSLDRGWLKLAVPNAASALRIRMPTALLTVSEGTVVMRQDGKFFEFFVESGSASIADAARAGRDGASQEAKAGEYWSRDGDKPIVTERRAPAKFVASMPRHLIDRLASLSSRFKGQKPQLAIDRDISLAEADPWLAGPYRRTFTKRFAGRLADPAFRKGVEANPAAYPEWERVLYPDRFPTTPGVANTVPPLIAAPQPAAPGGAPQASPSAKGAAAPPTAPPGSAPAAPPKPGPRTGIAPSYHLFPFDATRTST